MHQITEDQGELETIARLDERINVEEGNVRERRATIIHKGYGSQYLLGIEKFVKDIEKRWKGGFVDETTRYAQVSKIRELYLGKKYYRRMNEWLKRYSDMYRYSTRVEVFYDACKELRLLSPDPFCLGEPGDTCGADGMRCMDLFNALIDRVRERCQSREFTERERLRLVNAEKNKQSVLVLEEAMFSKETGRSRWLVLSLTLRYKPKFRCGTTYETVQQHRDRFFAARRFNRLMSGIRNYVWAIEQGEDTGLHLHVILFYSAEHNRDEFIAKQIGEYWVDAITEGKGEYWNSNAERLKRKYKERGHGVGVGQINWNDTERREALRRNLVYLAKAEQYLMIKCAERVRTFGMGKAPEKVKAGRPRVDVDANNATENLIDGESSDGADGNVVSPDEDWTD
ncbi:hypothetical protein WJ542_05465 [Paraburkholderia sp. B3]|uniref:hypothetical protein n=1 Tax=Paraburkholderia sp. B3 TaxID=3134791 RepID=UPI0039822A8D